MNHIFPAFHLWSAFTHNFLKCIFFALIFLHCDFLIFEKKKNLFFHKYQAGQELFMHCCAIQAFSAMNCLSIHFTQFSPGSTFFYWSPSYLFLFLIKVQLICNIVPISAVQRGDQVIHIDMRSFSHAVFHRVLFQEIWYITFRMDKQWGSTVQHRDPLFKNCLLVSYWA